MEINPCIIIHHGGHWTTAPPLTYVGGNISVHDNLPQSLNVEGLRRIIKCLGYKDIIKLHYLDPSKNTYHNMRFLGWDKITFDPFITLLLMYKVIHLYCEHENNYEDREMVCEIGEGKDYFESYHAYGSNGSFMDLLNEVLSYDIGRDEEDELNINVIDVNDYDELGTDNKDEEVMIAREVIQNDRKREHDWNKEFEMLGRLVETMVVKGNFNGDSDYEEDVSDLDSPCETSEEEDCGYLVAPTSKRTTKKTNVSYKEGTRPQYICFFVGQEFENAVQFRKAIIDYCVCQGRDVQYTKNHRDKVGAKCKNEGCKWRIWASWAGNKRTFMVKSHIPEHTCGRTSSLKKITASWIANHYLRLFKVNPYLKLQDIVDTIWFDWGVKVSMWMAVYARRKGQSLIFGEYKEQYGLLHIYALEILRSNSHNTVKFKLNSNVFQRMYICFDALTKGFKKGCRPFISLDGCFLKGPFGGQLLTAVGRDGNNQLFPIAWAIVEVESSSSWSWFLNLLVEDLGSNRGAGYTIMSDQQKGLLKAISDIWPESETRCCARHVYANFRGKFGGGQEYRKGFWKIAKSTTENEFDGNMLAFRSISNAAADDLLGRNYKKWCRAFYTPQSQCDNVDNNMSEVFNSYILNSRHKPIITMLEEIRESLMERLHKKRDYIGKKDCQICPRIEKKMEKSKMFARGWCAYWDGSFSYGVREGATQVKYVVNLITRTCSCNLWQLSGIPCNHVVAAIWKNEERPEDYVAECYTKAFYLKAYDYMLEPLNGHKKWPAASRDPISPLPVKKLRNRAPMKRRKELGEVTSSGKLRKTGLVIRCSLCGEQGYNKRGCVQPT